MVALWREKKNIRKTVMLLYKDEPYPILQIGQGQCAIGLFVYARIGEGAVILKKTNRSLFSPNKI